MEPQKKKKKKKMLSQKCAKQNEVDLSGGVGGMVNKVRKVLEEFNYLSW